LLRAASRAGCAPSIADVDPANRYTRPNEILKADKDNLRLTIEATARFIGEFRFTVLGWQYGKPHFKA